LKGKDVRNFIRDFILAVVAGMTVAMALYALRKSPIGPDDI
jgi:hypothetical protein